MCNCHVTIVYGGAFNPPTFAHVAILQACIEYARSRGAYVRVMLSGDRYDKTIPSARKRRMVYVDAMISDVESNGVAVEVNTTELDRQTMVETYDTVVELTARYPDRQTTWVFGADSTETMGEWKEGDNLLRKIDKLLIEREGSVVNPLARRAVRLMVQTPAVSSTEVRRRMERGEDCRELVSAGVIGVL